MKISDKVLYYRLALLATIIILCFMLAVTVIILIALGADMTANVIIFGVTTVVLAYLGYTVKGKLGKYFEIESDKSDVEKSTDEDESQKRKNPSAPTDEN